MAAVNCKDHHLDKWAVAYKKDSQEVWLQTELTKTKAERACGIVNEHQERNGYDEKFYVVEID